MPGNVEIDRDLRDVDLKQRLLNELRQILNQRQERWGVRIRVPIRHSLWEVRIDGPGYTNNAWLSAAAQTVACVGDVVRSWLAEFDHSHR